MVSDSSRRLFPARHRPGRSSRKSDENHKRIRTHSMSSFWWAAGGANRGRTSSGYLSGYSYRVGLSTEYDLENRLSGMGRSAVDRTDGVLEPEA